MSADAEKRAYDRRCSEAPIMYAQFVENQYSFYGAKMHNYCTGGMYFETDYPVRQGMIVSIRRADYSADCKGASTYTELQAEVKWCKAILDTDKPYYGAGVKFFIPVVDPPFSQNGL
ncbi:MAG: hypothetical protein P1P89_17530 [Desulfobacterales bacterium]|nr:hypothetical protein [Desulfobacterales bacterium]